MESFEAFESDMRELRANPQPEPVEDRVTDKLDKFFSDAAVDEILGHRDGPNLPDLHKRLRSEDPEGERRDLSRPRQVEALRDFLKRRIAQGESVTSLIEFSEDLSFADAMREAAASL